MSRVYNHDGLPFEIEFHGRTVNVIGPQGVNVAQFGPRVAMICKGDPSEPDDWDHVAHPDGPTEDDYWHWKHEVEAHFLIRLTSGIVPEGLK